MSVCVLQSHRSPLPHPWLAACLASVSEWAELRGYDYRFVGDALFDVLPEDIRRRNDIGTVIKSDLARLRYAQTLQDEFERVVWLDADVLVFAPRGFDLPTSGSAVGRENWIQLDGKGKLRNYRKVHNAAMVFARGDSLLGFYADSAERLLRANTAAMPAQFIGPKLLTALHNTVQLPVWENAGMMSPVVGLDLLGEGSGRALAMLRDAHDAPVAALNLCSSSCQRGELTDAQMEVIIDTLLTREAL